jgi:hypothetical protein
MTERSAPGEVRLTPLAPMMAWPARKAIKLATVPTAKAAAPRTPALAMMTKCRCGAAAKVERIIPVEYSVVITRTPRTPMASWASSTPDRLVKMGSEVP